MIVIGIGGMTQSGKSTLSRTLEIHLNEWNCRVIHQDDYYSLDKVAAHNSWETHEAIDMDKFATDVQAAVEANATEFLIVEGFVLFESNDSVLSFIDLPILLTLGKAECKKRREANKPVPDDVFEKDLWTNAVLYQERALDKLGGDLIVFNGEYMKPDEIFDGVIEKIDVVQRCKSECKLQ